MTTSHFDNMKTHFFTFLRAIAWLCLPILLASCGGDPAVDEAAENAAGRDDRIGVTVQPVNPERFVHSFSVQGNVETDKNATVTAEFGGSVDEIFVREGQRVIEGTPLLHVNTEVLERSLEEIRTQLGLAEDLFARQERLWKQEIGSEVEFLQARTQVEALRNSQATMLAQMDMAVVRAPFSGIVDRIFVKTGEMGMPGMPVARVIDLDDMYVRAMVSDHYAGRVSEGMPAQVIVSRVDTVKTKVGRVGQFINPANRSIEVTLPLPKGTAFLPNMFASVQLQDVAVDSAVVVRSALIQQDVEGKSFVYVARGGEAHKAVVNVKMGSGDEMWVASGLAFGDQIIDKGSSRVTDGEPIRILNP
ncbi:MAG: efflux RND transporter periplasmic adaptor subunit [Flavobacteriales bacterium]